MSIYPCVALNSQDDEIIVRYMGEDIYHEFDHFHLVIYCKNRMKNVNNFNKLIYGYFKLHNKLFNIPNVLLLVIKKFISEKYFDYSKYYGWKVCYKTNEKILNNIDINYNNIDTRLWTLKSFEIYNNRSEFTLFCTKLNKITLIKIWEHFDENNNNQLSNNYLTKLISFIILLYYKTKTDNIATQYFKDSVEKISNLLSNQIINNYSLQYIAKYDFINFIGSWLTYMCFSEEWRNYLNNENSMNCNEIILPNYESTKFNFKELYKKSSKLITILKEKHRESLWNINVVQASKENKENKEILINTNNLKHIQSLLIDIIKIYMKFDKNLFPIEQITPSMTYQINKCGEYIFNNYKILNKDKFILDRFYFSKMLNDYAIQ